MDYESIIAELVKKYTPLYDELTTSDCRAASGPMPTKKPKTALLPTNLWMK